MNPVRTKSKRKLEFAQKLIWFFEQSVFAPFLLSIQMVFQSFFINITQLDYFEVVRPVLAALLFSFIVFGVVYFFLRNTLKAGLIASPFLLFFFLFGEAADWLAVTFGFGPEKSNLFVLVFAALCMCVWGWLVQYRLRSITSFNLYFNLLSVFFLINSAIQLSSYLYVNGVSVDLSVRPASVTSGSSDRPRPDIYYIILDAYGRQDILQEFYDFDNSDFINSLNNKGFFVADQSSSNYVQTLLSISSALNMDYLQNVKINDRKLESRDDLTEIIDQSKVRTILAQNGYGTISFHNDYQATMKTADIYYENRSSGLTQPVTAFESIVFNNSMTRVLLQIPSVKQTMVDIPYETHREYILSTFNKLKDVPDLEGDYFVYAHVISPHPPFVFDENGEVVLHSQPFSLADASTYTINKDSRRAEYISSYRKQIQYINKLVLETVDVILAESKTPPIIIIQGDHGPGAYLNWKSLERTIPAERFGILNAYYFPDQDYSLLDQSISPVNSFRVVLDQFMDGEYEQLPDRHYYSQLRFPFDFIEVTDLSLP